MFGFRLISRGRGAVGRSGSGRRWLALFWGLALVPLLGWGQEIIEPPRNATVCVEEDAVFTSVVDGDVSSWRINGTIHVSLPPEIAKKTPNEEVHTLEGYINTTLTVKYNKTFDGLIVQSVAVIVDGRSAESVPVYVIYESNQQYPATNLKTTVNQTEIQVSWQASETMLPRFYQLSISDITGPEPIPVTCNDCQNITGTDYNFTPETDDRCHIYDVRVTEFQLLHPDCNITEPTEYATANATVPEIAPITIEYADRAVRVNWGHTGNNAYRITITDLSNNRLIAREACTDCPPYYFLPDACGRDYHLGFAITPDHCSGPAFTRQASIRFYSDCLKVARLSEADALVVQGESSGSRPAISGLLLLAAVLSLLQ